MKWCVTFPKESVLIVRPSLRRACGGNANAAKLLAYFLYRASTEEGRADGGSITIYRTQGAIVKEMDEELSDRTLRDDAEPCLKELGYLTTIEYKGSKNYTAYTIYPQIIQEGIAHSEKIPNHKTMQYSLEKAARKKLRSENIPDDPEKTPNPPGKNSEPLGNSSEPENGYEAPPEEPANGYEANDRLNSKNSEINNQERMITVAPTPSQATTDSLSQSSSLLENSQKDGGTQGSAAAPPANQDMPGIPPGGIGDTPIFTASGGNNDTLNLANAQPFAAGSGEKGSATGLRIAPRIDAVHASIAPSSNSSPQGVMLDSTEAEQDEILAWAQSCGVLPGDPSGVDACIAKARSHGVATAEHIGQLLAIVRRRHPTGTVYFKNLVHDVVLAIWHSEQSGESPGQAQSAEDNYAPSECGMESEGCNELRQDLWGGYDPDLVLGRIGDDQHWWVTVFVATDRYYELGHPDDWKRVPVQWKAWAVQYGRDCRAQQQQPEPSLAAVGM